jgi:predicted phosphodiesterase
MRVAVLADIHGNLPALDAVLRDVDDAGAQIIVLNGDIADGPMPRETLDRLADLGDRALWIRGNTDRWLVDAFDGHLQLPGLPTNPSAEWFTWCAERLDQPHRELLADLPLSVTLEVDGLGPVAFCHATARDDNEFILVDSPVSMYHDAFADLPAPTVVLGHTHMPFDRLADRRRFVNAGSVGLGYGHAGASWALLDHGIVLRRTYYDTEAAADLLLAASDLPGVADVAANVRRPESDVAALDAFTDTVRIQQRA